MPVQWVNRAASDFRGYAGTIAAGQVRPGDAVVVMPSGQRSWVTRVLGGGAVVVECVVRDAQVKFKPRRTLVVTVDDGTGELTLRFLNFYPSQQRALEPGTRIRAVGEIRGGFIGAEMIHPRWRTLTEGTPMPDRLTPVYPTTQGLSQPVLQRLVRRAVAQADLSETLPASLLGSLGLPPFDQSLHLLHAPPADIDAAALTNRTHPAWRRIKFDELLAQQLALRHAHEARRSRMAPRLQASGKLTGALLELLPFKLTGAQQRAAAEIARDLAEPYPMQRLLQGDVCSG
jgi:ATP-dependent DNA helicase RecG